MKAFKKFFRELDLPRKIIVVLLTGYAIGCFALFFYNVLR